MKRIKTLILFFLLITLCGMLGRGVFYLVYRGLIASYGETGFLSMIWYGLPLDLAIAGYATLLPTLIMIVAEWWNGKVLLNVWKVYQGLIVAALTIAFVANIGLYKYWGFPLDSTPLFFLLNSPQEFIACLTLPQIIFGPIFLVLIVIALTFASERIIRPDMVLGSGEKSKSVLATVLYVLLIGVQVIVIRGGFSVSVNNIGKVYFSTNNRLNHAAVNPVFSFLDSVTQDEDFGNQYRFMEADEADRLFTALTYTDTREASDSILTAEFRKKEGVRVVMVILESFSRYIMSDGGQGVTGVVPNLEKLAAEGVSFTDFYANSFRTDRGVLSILSGFPAQPTMSLMKYPHKTDSLYSIAGTLRNEGFKTQFVYGGDANFTNFRSYLWNTGFENIIAVEDYDRSIKRGKWGVDDEALFERALQESSKDSPDDNVLRVIQTSSSHEPYDVDWNRLDDKALNAFSYTDDCLGRFIEQMRGRPDWDRTLIVLVADHVGCYPENLDNNQLYRYQIPFILAGGAVSNPCQIDVTGSQQDIAATLLRLLGVGHGEFLYSKDLLDPESPHFAFFAVPDAMGMVSSEGAVIYDNKAGRAVLEQGDYKPLLERAKAYLQKLYDDIAVR